MSSIDIDPDDLEIIDTVFRPNNDSLILIYEYKKTVDEDADYRVQDEEIEAYKFVSVHDVPSLIPDYYSEFWNTYAS